MPACLPRFKNAKSCFFILLLGLLSIILISGCGINEQEELHSKDEAEREFIRICKQEYNWDVNTESIGNTLWIYIPYLQDIFKLKANKFSQVSKFSVTSLNGDFAKGTFYFEYQIAPLLKPEENKGYTYGLTDPVSQDFQNVLNAIFRVYFNAEQQPEFYVVVMADIANGVEVIYTIYGLDLKKIYSNAIASEEYYKRILQDIRGSLAIIRDKQGKHLIYQEINLAQFLAKQITQRIRIKFMGSDFELQTTTEEEILGIVSYCLQTYEFEEFLAVVLRNLSTGTETIKSLSALSAYNEPPAKPAPPADTPGDTTFPGDGSL